MMSEVLVLVACVAVTVLIMLVLVRWPGPGPRAGAPAASDPDRSVTRNERAAVFAALRASVPGVEPPGPDDGAPLAAVVRDYVASVDARVAALEADVARVSAAASAFAPLCGVDVRAQGTARVLGMASVVGVELAAALSDAGCPLERFADEADVRVQLRGVLSYLVARAAVASAEPAEPMTLAEIRAEDARLNGGGA